MTFQIDFLSCENNTKHRNYKRFFNVPIFEQYDNIFTLEIKYILFVNNLLKENAQSMNSSTMKFFFVIFLKLFGGLFMKTIHVLTKYT